VLRRAASLQQPSFLSTKYTEDDVSVTGKLAVGYFASEWQNNKLKCLYLVRWQCCECLAEVHVSLLGLPVVRRILARQNNVDSSIHRTLKGVELEFKGSYSDTPNNMNLTGGMLHLVQRGGALAVPQHAQTPPRCTECNTPAKCTHQRPDYQSPYFCI